MVRFNLCVRRDVPLPVQISLACACGGNCTENKVMLFDFILCEIFKHYTVKCHLYV